MASETHEGMGKQYKIEDMSGPQRPSTRGRVAAENPAVHNPANEERMKASYDAARRAAADAQVRIEQQQILPYEEPEDDTPPAPTTPKRQIQTDLRQLALTGRVKEEVYVGGYVFEMRTLTHKENDEAAAALTSTSNEIQRMGELQRAILARATQTVNGVRLEALYEEEPNRGRKERQLSVVEKKEAIIGSWQQTFVLEMMVKYNELLEKSQKSFADSTEEDLKN